MMRKRKTVGERQGCCARTIERKAVPYGVCGKLARGGGGRRIILHVSSVVTNREIRLVARRRSPFVDERESLRDGCRSRKIVPVGGFTSRNGHRTGSRGRSGGCLCCVVATASRLADRRGSEGQLRRAQVGRERTRVVGIGI